jgi:hypothetical protein
VIVCTCVCVYVYMCAFVFVCLCVSPSMCECAYAVSKFIRGSRVDFVKVDDQSTCDIVQYHVLFALCSDCCKALALYR